MTAAGVPSAARLDRRVKAEAKGLLKAGAKALATKARKMTAAERTALDGDLSALRKALAAGDLAAARRLLAPIDAAVDKVAAPSDSSPIFEYARSIISALVIALMLRAFVVEAFRIPSGSLLPTMQVGDFIFVNKLIYGLRMPFSDAKLFDVRGPRRGEIVVFRQPCTADQDFIKRIIGLPGDTVELRCNRLFVNGERIAEELVDPDYPFTNRDTGGTWIRQVRSRYRVRYGGETFSVLHEVDQPANVKMADDGWPEVWRAHEQQRLAEGATPEVLAMERTALAQRFPSNRRTGEFPDTSALTELQQCRDGKKLLVDVDAVTRRSAPEPDPMNPSCAPRLAYVVPPGHVFAMGDNRDDSNDSRGWGPVPIDHIKGKAMFIWLSVGPPDGLLSRFGLSVRWDRVGNFVH